MTLFFNNHRTLKNFWSFCNYQIDTTWFVWIFEESLIPNYIFQIINFTEI